MEVLCLIILLACPAVVGGIFGLLANLLIVRNRKATIFYHGVSPWRRAFAAVLALAMVASVWKLTSDCMSKNITSDGTIYFFMMFKYFIGPIAAIIAVAIAVRTKHPYS